MPRGKKNSRRQFWGQREERHWHLVLLREPAGDRNKGKLRKLTERYAKEAGGEFRMDIEDPSSLDTTGEGKSKTTAPRIMVLGKAH